MLQTVLPPGCRVVCYADDTLVLVGGNDWGESLAKETVAVHAVVRTIRDAGLGVAANKTEALFFYNRSRRPPPPDSSLVEGAVRVRVQPKLKYLGLTLDGGWSFRGHLVEAARRAKQRANTLGRLLPNLGGLDGTVRRLYSNVVRAVALYGALV